MISLPRLQALLSRFRGLTVGLVGDLFLDRYLEIEPGVHEVSIETGLEAYQVTRVRNSPGALGTVINNLAALGVGRLVPVTLIGDDGHGYDLVRQLERLPVSLEHVLQRPDRLTPTYTKPLKQDQHGRWTELNRLDVRTRAPLSDAAQAQVGQQLRRVFQESDGLIVLDQIVEPDWGVVNQSVRDLLSELASGQPEKLIFVDSRAHLPQFRCGVLKGNQSELMAAAGVGGQGQQAVSQAMRRLTAGTGRAVYCTLGAEGMRVARPNGDVLHLPACPVAGPVDIVGAGDSATSGIVAALLSGADEIEAGTIGNLVASITVQQLGTTGTASPQQILAAWANLDG